MRWNGFFWLRMWESCGLFWMRWWTSWIQKMRGISSKSEDLIASQEAMLLEVSYFGWTLLLTDRQTDNLAAVVWCVWTLRISDTIQVTTRDIALLSVMIIIFTSSHSVWVQTMDILFTALKLLILCCGSQNIRRLYLDRLLLLLYRLRKESFIIRE